jgi:hypothetical protein
MVPTTAVMSKNPNNMSDNLPFLGPLNSIRESEQPKVISCPNIVRSAVSLFSKVEVIFRNFPEDLAGRQSFWVLVCHCRLRK